MAISDLLSRYLPTAKRTPSQTAASLGTYGPAQTTYTKPASDAFRSPEPLRFSNSPAATTTPMAVVRPPATQTAPAPAPARPPTTQASAPAPVQNTAAPTAAPSAPPVTSAPIRPPANISGNIQTFADGSQINLTTGMPVPKAASVSNVNTSPTAPIRPPTTPVQQTQLASQSSQQDGQLDALRKAYLGTFAQTSEEQDALARLREIQATQANLAASRDMGLQKMSEQPIMLDLIRGQQQALTGRAAVQQGALTAQAQPLEAQITALQAQRALTREQAKAALGFTEADIAADKAEQAAQAEANKPIEIGGSLVQLNPATGQYEAVYQAPGEGAEGFTLGEGQARFDAQGNLIASGAAKRETQPATIQEYEYAKSQGFNGSYLDYQAAKESLGGLGISLSGSQISDALSKGYKSKEDMAQYARMLADGVVPPAADRSLSVEQSKARQFAMSADQANKVLDAINYNPGFIEFEGLPNQLKGEKRQQFEQASRAFVNSVLRRESGATITDDEFSNKYLELIPRAGDSKAVKDQKAIARATAVKSIQEAGFVESDPYQGGGGDALDQALQQLGFKTDLGTSLKGQQIGQLSAKYESGGDPGAIGRDTTGGWSYGTYQLAHNNAKTFIEQSPYASEFRGIAFNSDQFRNKWKEIAKRDPNGFETAQHNFIQQTHFAPQVQKLAPLGINVQSVPKVLQDTIWSTAVQHGPNTDIVANAVKKVGTKDLNKLVYQIYVDRWNNGQNFASSTPAVRQSVYNRFFGKGGELATALGQLNATTQNYG